MPIFNKKSMDISPIKAQVNLLILDQIGNIAYGLESMIWDIFMEKAVNYF